MSAAPRAVGLRDTATVRARQRVILERIDKLARLSWSGHDAWSDPTEIGSAVKERICASAQLRRIFEEDPDRLRGLLRTLVKHALVDAHRAARATKRDRPALGALRHELLLQRGGAVEPHVPELHLQIERKLQRKRLYEELVRFRLEPGASRFGVAQRRVMVTALRLALRGHAHGQIAQLLRVPKSTVTHRIDELVSTLAFRVSRPPATCRLEP